jgi:GntR family transcriptional regulator
VNNLLDKSQPFPLYYQVKENLMEKIRNNHFAIGDLIPSESELQQTYRVSRITIRRAIQELVQEGHLYTQQGKGTFVSKPKASQELNLISSWAETMMSLGMHPESKITQFTEEPAPVNISKLLNMPIGEKVYKIERIRYANGEPTCLMANYLVPSIVPGLIDRGLVGESLYEMLEKDYNIIFSRAEETVEAKAAKPTEAALLQVKRGAPLLYAMRLCDVT